jgi:ParB family chromosome partitioning protein
MPTSPQEKKIAYVSVKSLIPYARNSRTHSDEQVTQIASSIKEFGFTNPILIDKDNGVIAGHGRLMAAVKLGIDTVPTIMLDGLSKAQIKAYIIADNKLALNAGWDDAMLRLEFDELAELGFDLELTGFGLGEIDSLPGIDGELPLISSDDREPFQQVAFILHDDQKAIVDDAILLAKTNPCYDDGLNQNSNGNALTYICGLFIGGGNGS